MVSDPDGASNDTADWRLVCLQHNDAAQLMVDSMLVINMSASTDLGAGYLQICRALQLTPVSLLVLNYLVEAQIKNGAKKSPQSFCAS